MKYKMWKLLYFLVLSQDTMGTFHEKTVLLGIFPSNTTPPLFGYFNFFVVTIFLSFYVILRQCNGDLGLCFWNWSP